MTDPAHISKKDTFPPAPYARFQVQGLRPEESDQLLANGYFRSGVFVCSALARQLDNQWKSSLMLRIPLQDFSWKKRSRKLLRRNAPQFEVLLRPFQPRPKLEALWRSYKMEVHGWKNVRPLAKHLFLGLPPANFPCHELGIYDGNKLVAFSIFDKGHRSIASLEAAYHPDYQRFSLGYYTMLLELEMALQEGMDFYYPGFYLKDAPMFDYKLRPGGVEFFHLKTKTWRAWEARSDEDWLHEVLLRKLGELKIFLLEKQVPASLLQTFFPHRPGLLPKAADHPSYLQVVRLKGTEKCRRIRIGFNVLSEQFEVFGQEMVLTENAPQTGGEQHFTARGEFGLAGMCQSPEEVLGLCLKS